MKLRFETVDVFTDRRFGGNPLAVFPDASELADDEMQAIAAEMNLSETTFVLPPADPANTARVRIFNRTEEMAFAGHPCIGTAFVLSRLGVTGDDLLRFEVPAGIVPVELERGAAGVTGAKLTAPQPLSLGEEYEAAEVADCVGLLSVDLLVDQHRPMLASMGNPYVIACVTDEALGRASPDLGRFREFRARYCELGARFSLLLYSGRGPRLRARMFAPLAGTFEDPATGSAIAPLAGLLLSCSSDKEAATFVVEQGVEMGRPSELRLTAMWTHGRITATVEGSCVPVLSGTAQVRNDGIKDRSEVGIPAASVVAGTRSSSNLPTRFDHAAFAQKWTEAWNRRDLEAVLEHFADDAVFSSAIAQSMGFGENGVVRGKSELRRYWTAALERNPDLHFEITRVFAGIDTVVIAFRNQAGQERAEVLVFEGGLVARGTGMFEAPLSGTQTSFASGSAA